MQYPLSKKDSFSSTGSSMSSPAASPAHTPQPKYNIGKFPNRTVDAVTYGWKLAVPRLIRELDCSVSNSQICMRVNAVIESSVQSASLLTHVNEIAQQHQLIKTEAAKGVTALANLSKRLQEYLVISLACHIVPWPNLYSCLSYLIRSTRELYNLR